MDYLILSAALVAALTGVYSLVGQFRQTVRTNSNRLFVDTSALIDGRIIEIAKSGFISDRLVIPRSVVGELQLLADKGDSDKRSKARQGLDVITQLQALDAVEVEIFADNPHAREGVDQRLIDLAKQHGGRICTIDFNLNKVAVVEGVAVCNVNELAKNLRMTYLPGDKVKLRLTDAGQGNKQAVGHLDDGTMVVVEQAAKYIGKAVEVEFTRSLQTDAGRMMFARVAVEQQVSNGRQAESTVRTAGRKTATSSKSAGKKPVRKQAAAPRPEAKPPTAKTQSSQGRQKSSRRVSKASASEDRLVKLANK